MIRTRAPLVVDPFNRRYSGWAKRSLPYVGRRGVWEISTRVYSVHVHGVITTTTSFYKCMNTARVPFVFSRHRLFRRSAEYLQWRLLVFWTASIYALKTDFVSKQKSRSQLAWQRGLGGRMEGLHYGTKPGHFKTSKIQMGG